jgi:hypothetical protein
MSLADAAKADVDYDRGNEGCRWDAAALPWREIAYILPNARDEHSIYSYATANALSK